VGTVAAIGPGVAGMELGRRVLPLRGQGTWQDFVIAPAESCILVPDAFDDLIAAQLYINPMTAWLMLKELPWLRAGDVIAVNAAGSAIAAVLMRFAAASGVHSIAVVRHARHTRRLDTLRAMAVVDTSAVSLRRATMTLTRGAGLAAAFDAIGGDMGATLAHCLRPGGMMLHYGLLSGEPLPAGLAQMIGEGRQIRLFWLRNWRTRATTTEWRAGFSGMMAAMEACKVALPMAACHDLTKVQAAVAAAEKSERDGKIILTA
jgi:NADPH:quinone reductase-like Zn-dependent oxidoreductase